MPKPRHSARPNRKNINVSREVFEKQLSLKKAFERRVSVEGTSPARRPVKRERRGRIGVSSPPEPELDREGSVRVMVVDDDAGFRRAARTLIGATAGFIKTPFVLEGALLGGARAACALFLLRTLFGLAESKLAVKGTFWGLGRGLACLPDRVAVAFLLLGIMLGCLGSVVSLSQLRGARS